MHKTCNDLGVMLKFFALLVIRPVGVKDNFRQQVHRNHIRFLISPMAMRRFQSVVKLKTGQ